METASRRDAAALAAPAQPIHGPGPRPSAGAGAGTRRAPAGLPFLATRAGLAPVLAALVAACLLAPGAHAADPAVVNVLPESPAVTVQPGSTDPVEFAVRIVSSHDREAYLKVLPIPGNAAFSAPEGGLGWKTEVFVGASRASAGSTTGSQVLELGALQAGVPEDLRLVVHVPDGAQARIGTFQLTYAVALHAQADGTGSGGDLDPSTALQPLLRVGTPAPVIPSVPTHTDALVPTPGLSDATSQGGVDGIGGKGGTGGPAGTTAGPWWAWLATALLVAFGVLLLMRRRGRDGRDEPREPGVLLVLPDDRAPGAAASATMAEPLPGPGAVSAAQLAEQVTRLTSAAQLAPPAAVPAAPATAATPATPSVPAAPWAGATAAPPAPAAAVAAPAHGPSFPPAPMAGDAPARLDPQVARALRELDRTLGTLPDDVILAFMGTSAARDFEALMGRLEREGAHA